MPSRVVPPSASAFPRERRSRARGRTTTPRSRCSATHAVISARSADENRNPGRSRLSRATRRRSSRRRDSASDRGPQYASRVRWDGIRRGVTFNQGINLYAAIPNMGEDRLAPADEGVRLDGPRPRNLSRDLRRHMRGCFRAKGASAEASLGSDRAAKQQRSPTRKSLVLLVCRRSLGLDSRSCMNQTE
jgi:hypothetical protein